MSYKAGQVIGDYMVLDAVGAGGMGSVYKVQHVITRRIEAIKLLAIPHPGPEQERRFVREMQVQAGLVHPNITAVYNAFRYYNEFFLVLEFIEGESLQRVLSRGRLPLATGLDYVHQILSALGYAHAQGVVHRDIAPANMLVTVDGAVKVTDFGLAKTAAHVRLTHSGVPFGSPWYMSPEQVRGANTIDARSDIYSLGAVLYEIATGSRPFDGASSFDVMRGHLEMEPLAPIERAPELPPVLNQIIRTAMAKDPEARFQSAEDFRAALEGFQTADSGLARSAGRPASMQRQVLAAGWPGRPQSGRRRLQFARGRVVGTAIGTAACALLLFGGYAVNQTVTGRPILAGISSVPPLRKVSAPLAQAVQESPKSPVNTAGVPGVAPAQPASPSVGAPSPPNPTSATAKEPDNQLVKNSPSHLSADDAPRNKKEGNRFVRALHRMMPFHKQETRTAIERVLDGEFLASVVGPCFQEPASGLNCDQFAD